MIDISGADNTTFTEIPWEEFGDESLVSKLAFKVEFITKHIQGSSRHKPRIVPSLNSCNKYNRLPNRNRGVLMLILSKIIHKTLLISSQQGEFLVVLIVCKLQGSSTVQNFLVKILENVLMGDDVICVEKLRVVLIIMVCVIKYCGSLDRLIGRFGGFFTIGSISIPILLPRILKALEVSISPINSTSPPLSKKSMI